MDDLLRFIEVIAQIASIIIAPVALYVAWDTAKATRIQAQKATQGLHQNQDFLRADAVMHFTDSYFKLVGEYGKPTEQLLNTDGWAFQYWGFHSTEFYFFDKGVIPKFLYTLWMVDMADLYASYPKAWESHKQYLDQYANLYPKMKDFFSQIKNLSVTSDKDTRDRKVKDYIHSWIEKNRQTITE